jgi:rRNA maturation protein Rpf1
MVIFEYRFDILPGRLTEFAEYVERTGRPAWLRFPEVKGFRVYTNLFGVSSPQRVIQIEVEDLAALERIFRDPAFMEVRARFHSFVTNLSHSMLNPIFVK